MSESMRIVRRRNMMIFTNYANRAESKPDGFANYDLYSAKQVGAVEAGIGEPVATETPGVYKLTNELIRSLDVILNYAAANNLGPTKSSRVYYLWFFSVAGAYQWTQSVKRVVGVKDGWNWDIQYPLHSQLDLCIWMLSALEVINAQFPISYVAPWSALASIYLLSMDELERQKASVKDSAQFSVWNSAYATWWNYRAADGSVAAAVPPTDANLPNGTTRLDVALTQDPATFPSPESWTPLKIGAGSQKYMTYNWLDVVSPALTASDQTAIAAAANAHYPNNAARQTEIAEVVAITNALTDTQKVTAEFWAGGPFTISPPGTFVWIWKHYVYAKNMSSDLFVWSGLDLSLHLFETGRVVWGLKKSHMEARPIQEIRRYYRGQTVKKYDGTDIFGEAWVPYQETNFVTPPFADFPSGHSAFSRSFANVMTSWFGPSCDTSANVDCADIHLISPALRAQTRGFGSFLFDAGSSQIQTGVVPTNAVILSWTNWSDMAESAGISRKYGGIHATSAHTGSVAAADVLHSALNTNFPISIV